MSSCAICLRIKHIKVQHESACDFANSILCRRCHMKGHFTADCSEAWSHWENPTTYEELIPGYIKQRYNITTHTPIEYSLPRGAEGTEQQLHPINEVVIPKDYAKLLDFVSEKGIKVEKVTRPSQSNCIKAVKAWGIERGYRIVLQGE